MNVAIHVIAIKTSVPKETNMYEIVTVNKQQINYVVKKLKYKYIYLQICTTILSTKSKNAKGAQNPNVI